MENKQDIYKWVSYFTFALVVLVIQTSVLSKIRILGCVPSLMPFFVAAVAMFEGIPGGTAAGLFAGIISDAASSPSEGFFTVAFVICGISIGIFCTVLFRRTYFVGLFYGIICSILVNILYYLIFMLVMGQGGIVSLFMVVPGEILASLAFTPFVYIGVRKLYYHFTFIE